MFSNHRVGNSEFKCRQQKSIDKVVNLCGLRWLGYFLRMLIHRLPRHMMIADVGASCKKGRGVQIKILNDP